ncbi:hypothetical protein [Robertkochia flava]|uniref:hypothetical protein n=1 Tax=Robertkochia flava TaxID=3447986 RepID=UPI001CCD70B1|nr:hypothetical protein [Robertkochia marina]
MITKIELDFATLEFHDKIVVGTIYEGVDLSQEQGGEIFKMIRQQFGDAPYVLISNRKHSFSFNPFMHNELANKQPNLKGFAVVARTPVQRMNFAIEQMFIKIPSGYFSNLKDAKSWAKRQLALHPNTQESARSIQNDR